MSVVTLADAKLHLTITVGTYDTQLQTFIDRAEAAVATKVGPLSATTRTDRVRGMGKELVLPVAPVISLTSVTPVGGAALDLTSVVLDSAAGVLAYVAATQFNFARFPLPWYDVVYVAGRASVPADLLLAVLEMVRHLWATQRGSGTKRPGGDPDAPAAVGYTFPTRVLELLSPYMTPGFA